MIYQGDALTVLKTLPDGSVNCCVTSPPYYGLRDYGTAKWEGGDPACDHKQGRNGAGRADGVVDERGQRNRDGVGSMGGDCRKCGARRVDQQIGLESTPAEYIARLVEVFREVRRVLKDDATCWINIGDSYSGYHGNKNSDVPTSATNGWTNGTNENLRTTTANRNGIKAKDLIGVPWMLAFALRDDGWYLRSEIIWAKPNPMPESVQDRPTKSHEQLFLLSKNQRYYYDADAVSEEGVTTVEQAKTKWATRRNGMGKGQQEGVYHGFKNVKPFQSDPTGRRNRRSVWTMATQPTPEAHFATFPVELPETCLLAGTAEGGTVLDPFCGAGTTGIACIKNRREFIGIELNPEYIEIANKRMGRHHANHIQYSLTEEMACGL